MTPAKRQQRTVGAIVKIALGDGWHSYAQILPQRDCAVFDARTENELPVPEIVSSPILFRVAVFGDAVTQGRWPKVGKSPLREDFTKPIPKFMQDILRPTKLFIYLDGEIRAASRAECIGLERFEVWEPEQVESRIRDHYNGVPNIWVESLKLK